MSLPDLLQERRSVRWLSRAAQARRYGKAKRTIERWGQNHDLRMPLETWINGMPHRREDELDQWDGTHPVGGRKSEAAE
jgi:hypothetical protein